MKPWILLAAALAITGCATQRYGRMTPLSDAERSAMTCRDTQLEIVRAEAFLTDIRKQRGATSGAHVLGFMGDFGIGNVIEGDTAEASGVARLAELRALAQQKSCAAGAA